MKQNKINELLSKMGLKKLEIDCYLSLIKKSPQRASELSRSLEAHKPTVLIALSNLVDKYGLIKREQKKNRYLFLVEDVKQISVLLEKKAEEAKKDFEIAKNLIPELRGVQNYEASKPRVYYFEGKDGLKQAFEQVLDEADEIVGYGSIADDLKYLPKVFPNYYERRVARKIPVTKVLLPATDFNIEEGLKNEQRYLRQIHFVPKEFNYPIQINIYRDSTAFFSFEDNFALIVKNKLITECLRMILGLAFDEATEHDKEIRLKHQ